MCAYPPRPHRGLWTLSVLSVLAIAGGPAAHSETIGPGDSSDRGQPAPLILEDPLQPLIPERPRTEAERDRLEAFSLFAAARTHERQQEHAQALRLYQRALRCDPEALTVARSVISLAFRLDRDEQAVRYVLKSVDLEEPDPERLQRLGTYLLRVGKIEEAVGLYERALAAGGGPEQTPDEVRLRMLLGRLYHAIGEYVKAAECFTRARYALEHPQEFKLDERMRKQLLGEPGPAYAMFGECFLLADRIDEAQAAFEKAQQLAPNQGLFEFNRARVHARHGEPQNALAALDACFKQRLASEGTAPFELLADVLEDIGKKDELVPRLEKLRAEDPKNAPLEFYLAERYREAEQLDKAEPLYRDLIKEAPTSTGYQRLVEIYRKTGRPDALLAILGEVVAKTGLVEALGDQAQAVSGDANLMQSLVETARKKYQSEPKDLDYSVRFAVALLALEAKQLETAAEFFDVAIEAKSDQAGEVFLVWGVGLLLEERPGEAAEVFQRAIDRRVLPEDDPRLYYLLAGALALDDQTDQALSAARKAVEKKEDSARSLSRVAWILYRARRYDEAIEAYRQLIEKLDSDYTSSETRDVLREARLVLSALYVIKEDLPQAEEWLQQVLDEFPDDVGAANDLGYLWADENRHLQRALKMINYAVEAEPDNAAYRDSLGWIYYRLGRPEEAVAELQKAAAAEDEPDPVILDHLGDAHLKTQQPQEAKQAWRRAAKAFDKRKEPEKAKEVREKIKANAVTDEK